jgi:ABC-type bacteriocin/lantibiotic exporter with double-glycine peptidase domain
MLLNNLYHFWNHISARRKMQFVLLCPLILVTSALEIFSIGVVFPFIGALIEPEKVFNSSIAMPIIKLAGITQPENIALPFTILFIFAALFAGVMRLLTYWFSLRLSYSTGSEIGLKIFTNTLYQPYKNHISRNSSEIINSLTNKVRLVITAVIYPVITIISSSFILICILTILIFFNPLVALACIFSIGLIYIGVSFFTRRSLAKNSKIIMSHSSLLIKTIQESLGGIRDVIINGFQPHYIDVYRKADRELRASESKNQFIGISPRFVIESMGMVFIGVLAYVLVSNGADKFRLMAIVGVVALSAQRAIPLIQQLYFSWAALHGNKYDLFNIIDLLDQSSPEIAINSSDPPLTLRQAINLNAVSFRYGTNNPWVLRDVSIAILRGQHIGVVGKTGSGKSTLVDILMGLLIADEGSLQIDNQIINAKNVRSWQMNIAHVPQAIFLNDSTIEENIALGVPKADIDLKLVKEAAKRAQISNFIESQPLKYQTTVGERGVRLSGGQRQRIGIARALYKRANVIFFDEATSALDSKTENDVMDAIDSLGGDLTIIIIAHRISTLKKCHKIIELSEGRVKKIGNYSDFS